LLYIELSWSHEFYGLAMLTQVIVFN
jgi:hypothetical protein